jgi:hypothetical protein
MANVNLNAPSGLTPVSHINGGNWNGKTSRYLIAQSDTNAYYVGDVVVTTPGAGSGMVNGQIVIGLPQLTKAGTGANASGVITAIEGDPNNSGLRVIPAIKTRAYFIQVADDPLLVFQLQGDNTTTLATTVVGEFADLNIAASVSGYGVSGTQLATATIANNAALPLRVLGLVSGDFSANALFLVCFNLHELG